MWTIKSAQTEEDIRCLIEFCHLVHDPDQQLDDFEHILLRNPFIPFDSHHYIEEEGQIIAMVSLFPSQQYFNGHPLQVGQIALVGTHPDYRKRGLSRELILDWMQRAKTLTSPLYYLYGIPGFYEQFDFSFAIPSFHPRIELTQQKLEILQADTQYRVRNYQPQDLAAIMNLYEQTYGKNNCANVRTPEHWNYYLKHFNSAQYPLKVVLNMQGLLCGYIWLAKEEDGLLIREAASLNRETSDHLLTEARFHLRQSAFQTLSIQTPQDHQFGQDCYAYGAAFYSAQHLYHGVWAGMYRLMDIEQCLQPAQEVLSHRLLHSRFYDWQGELNFQTGTQCWGLKLAKGQVIWQDNPLQPELSFPLPNLNACFTGYRGLDHYPLPIEDRDLKDLLGVLFPTSHPHLSEIDNIDELV